MAGENSVLLFEDRHLLAYYQPGTLDFLLITFSDLIFPVEKRTFFAQGPAAKMSMPCLGLVAKKPNWFPPESVRKALEAMRPQLDAYRQRVLYGGSMGGYAAVKYSALFEASHVVSLCPQWSIDPAECGGVDPGWGGHFTRAMAGMGIVPADVAGRVYLFLDTYDRRDRFHAGKIQAAYPSSVIFSVPWVGHNVTGTLSGTSNLFRIVRACMEGNHADLYSIVRSARIARPKRRNKIVELASSRHPALVSRLVGSEEAEMRLPA
ncbi:hypothetical protein [Ancylobacter oerskovii]|nr:hypothetical protein [Ancylobacter oerskovii]MBS7541669.1 hypothetical protein [Ancylobacter oerskovii]